MAGSEVDPDAAARLLALLDKAATAYGRTDLADHVRSLAASVAGREVTVAVVGEHQAGKSSLVNALLGLPVAPVVRGASTAVAVRVAAGDAVVGHLPEGEALDLDIPADRARWEAAVTSGNGGVCTAEAPSPLLDDGLVLVDMPGTAGPLGAIGQRLVALPVVDAVVMVTSITQELTADELDLLGAVHRSGRPVLVVGAKADLQPAWRRLLERDRAHLAAAGLDVPAVAVSSPLRELAMRDLNDDVDDESGYPGLVDWLYDDVLAQVARHRHRTIVATGREVVDALAGRFEAELAALIEADDPAAAVGASGEERPELSELRRRAREMESAGNRWATQLTGLLNEMSGEVERDLRARGQTILAESDERLAAGDPATTWDELARWLDDRIAVAMSDHLTWRHERLVHAVEESTASFGQLVALVRPEPAVDARAGSAPSFHPAKVSVGASVYAALRGSYGGLAMVGFFGGLAGVALTAPITVGIGLVLGGKQLRDERAKQLATRRSQARTAIRTYVDQVWSEFGTGSRNQLRALHTSLRTELTGAVERLRTDTRVALDAAIAAAGADVEARRRRRLDVEAELTRLGSVRTRLDAFASIDPAAALAVAP